MTNDFDEYRATQAEEWMRDVRRASLSARNAKQRLDEVRAVMDGIGAVVYDKVGGAAGMEHGDDAMAARVMRLDAATGTWAERYADFMARVQRADLALDRLDDPRHARLLRLHYFDLWEWERVCTDMGYSYSHMMRLRFDALLALYDVIRDAPGVSVPDARW